MTIAVLALAWLVAGLHASEAESDGAAIVSGAGGQIPRAEVARGLDFLHDAQSLNADKDPEVNEVILLSVSGSEAKSLALAEQVVAEEPGNVDTWFALWPPRWPRVTGNARIARSPRCEASTSARAGARAARPAELGRFLMSAPPTPPRPGRAQPPSRGPGESLPPARLPAARQRGGGRRHRRLRVRCFCPRARVRSLSFVVDGEIQPVTAQLMPAATSSRPFT